MFRLWGKIVKDNTIIMDHVFELTTKDVDLEEKTKQGLETLCYEFDIQKPMWFSDNNNYSVIGQTRFMDQHFIETIDFDYLEIEIIENKD